MTRLASEGGPAQGGLALAALLLSVCATVLESMAVSVAIPAISSDFGVSASAATWVMASAQFVIVALLLPMAALGEALGYRRVFLASLAVFSAATLVCMLAPSFPALVAARALQAVGTAGAMSLGFAILRTVFSDARLGTAIGLMAATVALASSLGPAMSGLILSVASWRAVFGLMGAISLAALLLGTLALPPTPAPGRRFDLAGAALVAGMLSAALVVINGLAHGWPAPLLMAVGLLAALALVPVVARSRGAAAPVLPIDLLARPVFSLSVGASVCAFIAQTMGFILLPFYLLYGAGMDEVGMALALSVWPAATAILAPVVGRLADRIPAGPAGAAGLVVMAAGFVLIARIDATATSLEIALRFALCGAGFAIFQTPNNRLIMLSAPRERSGAASGTLSLARQIGRAIGTAIAAFALTAGPAASLDAMWVAAFLAVLGALASLGRLWTGRLDS